MNTLKSCPCFHTTPCKPNCTCVKPFSSAGCSRCCSYGSEEQQIKAAERITTLINLGQKTLDKLINKGE